MDLELAFRFAAALGLGVLLGLERQRVHGPDGAFAGVRTMGLVALLGATSYYLGSEVGLAWAVTAAFVAVAALSVVSYAVTASSGEIGVTTEVTVLMTFFIGVLCASGHVAVAGVAAVATLLLLALKEQLHGLAKRIQSADVEATLKFAIITLIVLPLLPNRGFGPSGLEVVNPYEIWLMVVLISGLNFAGYVLVKVLGNEHGLALTGALGGLASSTAVTLGFSQRSRVQPSLAPGLALGILLAWTVMFLRVGVLLAVVNPELAVRLALGLASMGGASLIVCLLLRRKAQVADKGTVASGQNPFELGQAIKFGLVFGVVTFVAKAAEVYLGAPGLYLAGAMAGLTDVDAISLSMANLAAARADLTVAAGRAVLIAILANTVVKGAMTVTLGSPSLRKTMAPIVTLLVAVGLVAIYFVG